MPAVRKTKLMELIWKVHPWLYRKTGGRISAMVDGVPILLLTTTGRHSSQLCATPLVYVDKNDAYIVAASYAGEPRHPAWWLNLQANPRAQIQRGRCVTSVVARQAHGEERERLWSEIVAQDSGFAEYERRTTRHIPVVVLEPSLPESGSR